MKDLLNKINQAIRTVLYAVKGTVSVNHKDRNAVSVEAANELRSLPLVAPWGFRGHPPPGTQVQLILNWGQGREATVAGVITNQGPVIEPGECALWHKAGMQLLFKNDGTVRLHSKQGVEVLKVDQSGELFLQGRRVKKPEEGATEI